MEGWVRRFVAARGYGFIDGDDGVRYFFHLDDVEDAALQEEDRDGFGGYPVRVVRNQRVSFRPDRTPKGPRARSVRRGASSQRRTTQAGRQKIYVNPDHFIMTRDSFVRGYEVVKVLSEGCWGLARDPNEAKDLLKQQAVDLGGNAIVNLWLEKLTEQEGCSNYRYTVHKFYGDAVVIKKIAYSSDPQLIARSEAEMEAVRRLGTYYAVGLSEPMTRPPLMRFAPVLAWSLVRTFATIGLMLIVLIARKATPSRFLGPGAGG
ncbi:hypothetical protein AB0G05_30875 [Nonomuraea wenchangensis]